MMDFIRVNPGVATMAKPARPDFIRISVSVLPPVKVGR